MSGPTRSRGPDRRARRDPKEGEPAALLALEREFWARGLDHIAGVDEAGRGPLAGPVVAAAVVLPWDCFIDGVDDSKRLSGAQRERLAVLVQERALAVGIGAASSREIDQINILQATHLAMSRAISQLGLEPDHVIVDGLPVPSLGEAQTAVVGGDRQVHSIACASILAKVTRDRLMRRLAERHPGYGWERNAGYGTPQHREALMRLGPTPHHRRSFAPVQLSLSLDQ